MVISGMVVALGALAAACVGDEPNADQGTLDGGGADASSAGDSTMTGARDAASDATAPGVDSDIPTGDSGGDASDGGNGADAGPADTATLALAKTSRWISNSGMASTVTLDFTVTRGNKDRTR